LHDLLLYYFGFIRVSTELRLGYFSGNIFVGRETLAAMFYWKNF
jgi:hypothetical protein